MINDILNSIGSFLSGGGDPKTIRSSILDALSNDDILEQDTMDAKPQEDPGIKQPLLPEVARFSNQTGFEVPDYEDAESTENPLEPFFKVDTRPDSVIKAERDRQLADAGIAEQDIVEDRLGLTQNRGQAMKEYIDRIKKLENPEKKGFITEGGVGKFMMFKSIDEAKVPGLSEYEIGYGIKVKDDWLKPDKTKWTKINGVYVDVTKGLTVEQVDTLLENRAGKDRAVASSLLNKWGDMTEQEKSAWTDLTYNGGSKAIRINKNARAAANKGYTLEGLVKLFDYIRAGKNRYRGLLKRRINVYNKAALSVTGAPIVEEYKWGAEEVMVKFSSSLRSEKFSKAFSDKINKKDGWYTVPTKGEGKSKTFKVGDGYQFE
jgi:GH24 family phage-related lysozyme (muramidase)